MPGVFKRVILYARQYRANDGVNQSLLRLIEFLNTHDLEVYQDVETAAGFKLPIPILNTTEIDPKRRDLMIVVGGDGSMLSAARMAVDLNIPVIGINRGQLGFLTDITPQNMESYLSAVLAGEYSEENRFLLRMQIWDKEGICHQALALNDVVLNRGNDAKLIEFEVHIDGQIVSHYRADGLILATPTGSTAYALSAGGPIMHPQLNAMVLVPMFSHSLSSRPLVFNADSRVVLTFIYETESLLKVNCDSQEIFQLKPDQYIVVEKNDKPLRLLHPKDYHYYDTLRMKLGWSHRHPTKSG